MNDASSAENPSKPHARHQLDRGRRKKSPAHSLLILWGLLLGVLCGLFFGELCRPLKFVGDAFIKLLQVTVMPYIMVSLILGIGSLTGAQARELADHFKQIGDQLRLSYELGYHSSNPVSDDSFHKLKIRLRPGLPEGLTVRAKTGYYARPPGN